MSAMRNVLKTRYLVMQHVFNVFLVSDHEFIHESGGDKIFFLRKKTFGISKTLGVSNKG